MSLKTWICLSLLIFSTHLRGNEKFPRIRFYADIAYNPVLSLQLKQQYKGEFYPFSDPLTVEWSETDNQQKIIPSFGYWSVSGHVGVNFWKGLYTGIRYQLMQVNGYSVPGLSAGPFLDVNSSFFFLTTFQAGYIFQPLSKHPEWTILPMAGIGSYFANDYFTGPGRKWLINTQVKTQYLFKEKWGLYVAPGFSYWQYKDKGFSNVFQRETLDKIQLSQWYLEAGVSFSIQINRKP
jgi:hypothetical protein